MNPVWCVAVGLRLVWSGLRVLGCGGGLIEEGALWVPLRLQLAPLLAEMLYFTLVMLTDE